MPEIDESVQRVPEKVVCDGCGRTIKYFKNEVVPQYSTDYTGGRDWEGDGFKCPAGDCKKVIYIKRAGRDNR